MDEVVFRASETIDSLQHHLRVAADEGKAAIVSTSGKLSDVFVQALNNDRYLEIKDGVIRYFTLLFLYANDIQEYIVERCNPAYLYEKISWIFTSNATKRDVLIGGTGIIVGFAIGYYTSRVYYPSKQYLGRCMQAVQCLRYSGFVSATVVDDAIGPTSCESNQVLIDVKACSLNKIDKEICHGYGSRIRGFLIKNFKYYQDELPVTLGRDCAGIIVEIGRNVTRFEVGDTVWATTPFWSPGTMSKYVALPERHVGKMPPDLGFESATSIPFCGGIALDALKSVDLNVLNAEGKTVFVHGGCSAVGCLVVQILNYWGAKVTVSCYKRAVPVARALQVNDIIPLTSYRGEDAVVKSNNAHLLKKELDLHEKFWAIIVTVPCEMDLSELKTYCKDGGNVILTLPQPILSDRYGFLLNKLYGFYIQLRAFIQKCSNEGLKDFGETHICYEELDRLSQYIENGVIQSVVDRVYQPYEIDQALTHIQTLDAIGSTVITFR
nr:reticulon-4-interacting protein 1 homolog, mitochondrial-like isoform X1 [Onthophagus taurus]